MTPAPTSSGINLRPAPKVYDREQDKSRPPEQTVVWAKERFARLGCEVLERTLRIDTGRLDIPVYLSLCGQAATALTNTKKQMGKGASPSQAEASALMELAERYSFFAFVRGGDFPRLTAAQAPEPRLEFARVAQSVHHPAPDLARAEAVYQLLPQTWAWARDLAADREVCLPLGWFYAINEYNGPSAGNCQEEAVLQGLCEVVERHVSALVTLGQLPTPAIDPASVTDPVARELIDKFERAGIEVRLKDFTCGMGIPTVAAICWDPANFPEQSEIVYAAGTATSPAKALIRALTEVAQLAGDFHTGSNYKVSALPKFADLGAAEYVTRAAGVASLDSLPDLSAPDFLQEVRNCVAALAQRGFGVYCLDVTHPDLGIPAVYTIVPGAHFAYRTTGTDVIFHAAKLASQLPDPEQALAVLSAMSRVAADGGAEPYYLAFFRALALINLERPAEALADLERALGLDPPAADAASIHTQRGVALKDLGRHAEAVAALTTAAGFPEPHAEVFNLLGFCHYMLKDHEKAIEAFARAIELEPGLGINYANIGSNLRELGRIEEACHMYRQALELDPSLDFARANLERLSPGRS
ncbi:MAG: YcaO-like family protein [Desulfarculus sp.]|nr:YcaO-like family protein [Desulfarculus sp.]